MHTVRTIILEAACCGRHYELSSTVQGPAKGQEKLTPNGSSPAVTPRSPQGRSNAGTGVAQVFPEARHALHQMKGTAALKLNENMAALASYVPSAGLDLIHNKKSMPSPIVCEEKGIAAIIDLSGFTKMCAELSSGSTNSEGLMGKSLGGQVGVLWRTVGNVEQQANASESAQQIVNAAFGALIDVIIAHGGDILRIAGDALIVIFPVEEHMEELSSGNADVGCACRAALCALECIDISRLGKIPMKVHIGMSFGVMRRFHVGGISAWQVVVAGEPMREAGLALDQSAKLEVMITQTVWSLLDGRLDLSSEPTDGNGRFLKLNSRLGSSRPSWVLRPQATTRATSWTMRRKLLQTSEMPEIAKRALRVYVPNLVLQGTVTGVSGALAEIRRLTCVFVEINLDLTKQGAQETLQLLQSIFQTIQMFAVIEYGGTIKELTCDDKGLVCVIGFGFLQPVSRLGAEEFQEPTDHPELVPQSSAASACLAAVHIERELEIKHKTACYIGIASGMVYCAALGNDLRKELAMVSSTMNTAARLMSLVKKGTVLDLPACKSAATEEFTRQHRTRSQSVQFDVRERRSTMRGRSSGVTQKLPSFSDRILCTDDVRQDVAASQDISFHELQKVSLKGYSEPISVFMVGVVLKEEDETHDAVMRALTLETAVTNNDDSTPDSPKHLLSDLKDISTAQDDVHDWRIAYLSQQLPLSYAQYFAMLPAYFNARDVQLAAADYVWIRSSGGIPTRIAELVRHYTSGGLGGSEKEDDIWYFCKSEFTDLLDAASQVPHDISQKLLRGISKISPLNQLILKVIAVLGGSGRTDLLRHLLSSVEIVRTQWRELCDAFEQKYNDVITMDCPDKQQKRRPSTLDILMLVLEDLREYGILEVAGDGEQFNCKDFLMVDTIYSNLTFTHRKILHSATASWMRATHAEIHEAASLLPNIIHHLMMSQQESRAYALLGVVRGLGSRGCLEHFMVEQVQWYIPLTSHGNDNQSTFMRAEQALPAIPSLRGLAKAMQQHRVAGAIEKSKKLFLKAKSKTTV